jgi:hypothetical protein
VPEPASASCFSAQLPDSLLEGETYTVRAGTVGDTIVGRTRIPPAPRLLAPHDTTIRVAGDLWGTTLVLHYAASADAARTVLDVGDVVVYDTAGVRHDGCALFTDPFPGGEPIPANPPLTVTIRYLLECAPPQWSRIEATFSLLAFDSAYVRFMAESDQGVLRRPWPAFGIERGVGLFAAAARSAGVRVDFVR